MQYQRHNFAHNFLNAVGADRLAAWDILVNEINEIVLEYPKETEKVIRDNGMRLHSNPSPRDLVDVVHEGIYVNEPLRKAILKIIAKRHSDPYYAADGGAHDNAIIVDGKVLPYPSGEQDLLNDSGELLNFVFEGAKKLVSGAKDRVQGAAEKLQTKNMATDNLASKEKQRNLPVSRPKGTISTGMIIGISVAAVAAISLVAYLIYKSNKTS